MAYSFSTKQCFALTGLLGWLLLGLLTNSCQQADPLPGPTQSGQNTFGCLLNGKAWVPNGGGWSGIKPLSGGLYRDPSRNLRIYVTTFNSKGESVHLYLERPTTGEHPLNSDTGYLFNSTYASNYGYYQASDGQVYMTSAKSTGKVTITRADTLTGLLSGTFAFTATAKSGASVQITEGRFDMISPQ